MRKKIVPLFFIFIAFSIHAENTQDVFVLDDGYVYRGSLVGNSTEFPLQIKTENGFQYMLEKGNIIYKNGFIVQDDKIDFSNGYNDMNLNALISCNSINMTNNKIDETRVVNTMPEIRLHVYDSKKKTGELASLLMNLFVPGFGSIFQGDVFIGIYQLGSFAGWMTYKYFSPDIPYSKYYWGVLTANFVGSYISGIVTPFIYESNYNSELMYQLKIKK